MMRIERVKPRQQTGGQKLLVLDHPDHVSPALTSVQPADDVGAKVRLDVWTADDVHHWGLLSFLLWHHGYIRNGPSKI
jgi:hypothetical protein